MFDVACENAVLTPGDWMKTWMIMGSKPGTVPGEAWRTFTQFKGYALNYVDRVLMAGWQDADGAMARLGWGLQMFTALLPMSYASLYLDNAAKGLTMPDWDQMNYNEKIKC
jgi:hypothetical protein